MASNLDDIKPMVLPRTAMSTATVLILVAILAVVTVVLWSVLTPRSPAIEDRNTTPSIPAR